MKRLSILAAATLALAAIPHAAAAQPPIAPGAAGGGGGYPAQPLVVLPYASGSGMYEIGRAHV